MMEAKAYWDQIGSQKDFEDPLYLERLEPFISREDKIVEYGCGYGRLLNLLDQKGYKNLVGFDFAKSMIDRGAVENPHLKMEHIKESGKMPLPGGEYDLCFMLTILTCMLDSKEQQALIHEVRRVLRPGGVFYLSDFLICDHPRYVAKYQKGYEDYGDFGVYTTDEGLVVKHHAAQWIFELLRDFDIQWFEQFDFKTMNGNVARTFHCIAKNIK